MDADKLFKRYQELQRYVGWTDADVVRIERLAPLVEPRIVEIIDDFYDEIDRHPDAKKVITGGTTQVERLKQTLRGWLRELLSGNYDREYVARRWRVGWRHVEIGLNQVYTNVALSRLRAGLISAIEQAWRGDAESLADSLRSVHRLLDLDLAIIEDAYQTEYLSRHQQVERLAAVGQMAGGVAHELRQPLNVIGSSVYYLRNARDPSSQKVAEHLERIDRQVQLANSVITAMSDFARMPLPEVKAVNVEDALRNACETITMPPNVAMSVKCPPSAAVLADAGQLRIVLSNLIRNARDAMPDGGLLQIIVEPGEQYVDLAFHDTGVGIRPEDLPRIMEPMYTTKPRGIGLGLTITRAIVVKHGGHIRVHSEVGVGSRFTVVLPASTKAHDQNGS